MASGPPASVCASLVAARASDLPFGEITDDVFATIAGKPVVAKLEAAQVTVTATHVVMRRLKYDSIVAHVS